MQTKTNDIILLEHIVNTTMKIHASVFISSPFRDPAISICDSVELLSGHLKDTKFTCPFLLCFWEVESQ